MQTRDAIVAKYCGTGESKVPYCEEYVDTCAVQRQLNVSSYVLVPYSGIHRYAGNYMECLDLAGEVAKETKKRPMAAAISQSVKEDIEYDPNERIHAIESLRGLDLLSPKTREVCAHVYRHGGYPSLEVGGLDWCLDDSERKDVKVSFGAEKNSISTDRSMTLFQQGLSAPVFSQDSDPRVKLVYGNRPLYHRDRRPDLRAWASVAAILGGMVATGVNRGFSGEAMVPPAIAGLVALVGFLPYSGDFYREESSLGISPSLFSRGGSDQRVLVTGSLLSGEQILDNKEYSERLGFIKPRRGLLANGPFVKRMGIVESSEDQAGTAFNFSRLGFGFVQQFIGADLFRFHPNAVLMQSHLSLGLYADVAFGNIIRPYDQNPYNLSSPLQTTVWSVARPDVSVELKGGHFMGPIRAQPGRWVTL